jgi:hypothetical protein
MTLGGESYSRRSKDLTIMESPWEFVHHGDVLRKANVIICPNHTAQATIC